MNDASESGSTSDRLRFRDGQFRDGQVRNGQFREKQPSEPRGQLALFPGLMPGVVRPADGSPFADRPSEGRPSGGSPGGGLPDNGQDRGSLHLLAARRIARKMGQIRDREAETRAGLAICAQLKAYLQDGSNSSVPSRH